MKVTYCFDRGKPFPEGTSGEYLEQYRVALTEELAERFPQFEIAVELLDEVPGDVEFEPEDALSADDRLRIAVDMKRIANRLAERMLADSFPGS